MPKRDDIQTVMLIGSGPIVIGQGCEFDYSGTQACKALREEGFRIVLVNSNPATIMTDPEFADRTYIEPITPEVIDKILAREAELGTRVDAILPTLGGQTEQQRSYQQTDLRSPGGDEARHQAAQDYRKHRAKERCIDLLQVDIQTSRCVDRRRDEHGRYREYCRDQSPDPHLVAAARRLVDGGAVDAFAEKRASAS